MFEALRLDQADEKVLNELRTEAQMMERLSNHPGIVKFVGAITKGWLISAQPQFFLPSTLLGGFCCLTTPTWLCARTGDDGANFALVTEFCPRGSLYDLLVLDPHTHGSISRRSTKPNLPPW